MTSGRRRTSIRKRDACARPAAVGDSNVLDGRTGVRASPQGHCSCLYSAPSHVHGQRPTAPSRALEFVLLAKAVAAPSGAEFCEKLVPQFLSLGPGLFL
jgi:hypothetical protein